MKLLGSHLNQGSHSLRERAWMREGRLRKPHHHDPLRMLSDAFRASAVRVLERIHGGRTR